jgi:hypothetical protein
MFWDQAEFPSYSSIPFKESSTRIAPLEPSSPKFSKQTIKRLTKEISSKLNSFQRIVVSRRRVRTRSQTRRDREEQEFERRSILKSLKIE